jgi:alpha-tubulin suppressor-like RCC1 family protein
MFLSNEGHVFACGSGRDGTLGIGSSNLCFCGLLCATNEISLMKSGFDAIDELGNREDVHVPFLVRSLMEKNVRVKKIFAGYYQSAAIDDQDQLYTWGWGDDGSYTFPNS